LTPQEDAAASQNGTYDSQSYTNYRNGDKSDTGWQNGTSGGGGTPAPFVDPGASPGMLRTWYIYENNRALWNSYVVPNMLQNFTQVHNPNIEIAAATPAAPQKDLPGNDAGGADKPNAPSKPAALSGGSGKGGTDQSTTTPGGGGSGAKASNPRLNSKEAFGTFDGPCLVRTCIAIAETRANGSLDKNDFAKAMKKLKDTFDPDFNVKAGGRIAIMNWALQKLGIHEKAVPANRKTAQASIILGHLKRGNFDGRHYVEGNKEGNFNWDPSGYTTNDLDSIEQVDYYKFESIP
jgi:hypothetical protein